MLSPFFLQQRDPVNMRRSGRLINVAITLVTVFLMWTSTVFAAPVNLAVSATILSNHNCKFNSNVPVALDFGNLNPLAGSNVTRTTTLEFECKGNKNAPVSYAISDDDGLNESGVNANRLKHVTLGGANAYIPYAFSIAPSNGTTPLKTPVTLTITGTVLGPSYQFAYAGNYTDTVVVRIDP